MTEEQLVTCALSCGATRAQVISRSDIVLNRAFRNACEANHCGMYGRCYTCPPDVGDIDALMAKVQSYDKGLLYQYVGTLEDSFDIEGMGEAAKQFGVVCQRVLTELKPVLGDEAFFLTGGSCSLCDTCGKLTGEPCRHPDRTMPSVESCGVDVSRTVRHTTMKYINGANTVTYFGLALYMEN